MKEALQATVIGAVSYALVGLGMPAQAADRDFSDNARAQVQYRDAARRGDHDRDRRDDRDDRYRRDDRDRNSYYVAPQYGAYYQAPAYGYYEAPGYYDTDHHAGRSAAIVAGSAAAGAVIGAAAGHGQGAAIGAIVGGVAGVIADQAVRHHDYR